jgi:hypothetical protein
LSVLELSALARLPNIWHAGSMSRPIVHQTPEANLREYVDEAWKELTVIGLSSGASHGRLSFTTNMKERTVAKMLRRGNL